MTNDGIKNKKQLRRDLYHKNPDCPSCGRRMVIKFKGKHPPNTLATIDHTIPRVAGGGDNIENLQLMCLKCNFEKDALMPEEVEAQNIVEPKGMEEALEVSAANNVEPVLAKYLVSIACNMCVAMGIDPNAAVVEGEETLNWQFMLPGASAAYYIMEPMVPPEGDMLSVPAPDGSGFLIRIDHDGQLHMREGLADGVPLFTLVNKHGDVTLANGNRPPMKGPGYSPEGK